MAKQTGYSKAQCTINTGTAKVSSAQDRRSIYNTTMVLHCQSAPATSVSRYGHPCHRHAAALLFTPHTIPYSQQQRVSSLPGLPSVKPERSELSWLSFVTHTRPSLQPKDRHSPTRPHHASPQATTGDTQHPLHPVPSRETHPHAPRGQSNIRHSAISPRIPPTSAVYSLFTQSINQSHSHGVPGTYANRNQLELLRTPTPLSKSINASNPNAQAAANSTPPVKIPVEMPRPAPTVQRARLRTPHGAGRRARPRVVCSRAARSAARSA